MDIDKPVFQMKPDIALLDQGHRVVVIADAKWKLLDPQDAKLGVSQADLYQIQGYANRYGVKNVLLIYPAHSGLRPVYEMTLQGLHQSTLRVVAVDVVNTTLGWSTVSGELNPSASIHTNQPKSDLQ
tara:strand:- start:172 stop:552 length:381 start_codon:yes stop_codon:yes gene_type:complete